MKQLTILMIAGMCGALLMAGCATSGKTDPSADVAKQVNGFLDALKKQDIDAVMPFFSENFKHYEWKDKAGARDFLKGAIDMGYLEDLDANIQDMEIKVEDAAATAEPVHLSGSFGSVTLDLEFAQEGSTWLITGLDAIDI